MIELFQPLSSHQTMAFNAVFAFLAAPDIDCFILRGGAGTGKTTLIAAMVRKIYAAKRQFQLLAPTGRAARILGRKTHYSTNTIHAAIYAFDNLEVFEHAQSNNDPGMRLHFRLKTDDPGDTLFIVDEASMVADVESDQDLLRFGSGRLLADLIEFTRIGRPGRVGVGARLLFIGDSAQLPPVGQTLSPALSPDYLRDTFGFTSVGFELTEVMRQKVGSAILDRSTLLRNQINSKVFNTFDLSSSSDEVVAGSVGDGVSLIAEAHRSPGGSSVLITHSNSQALDLNRAVRARLWSGENPPPQVGDLLLVNRNNIRYGLFNGDLIKAVDVAPVAELRSVGIKGVDAPIDLMFRSASVAYRTADGQALRIDCLLLENLLDSHQRSLTPVEQRAMLVDFRKRNPDLKPQTAEFKLALLSDPYFNALQVKYGYAITCHKAQGGEWDTAVVQFGDGRGTRSEEFFRWTYTAITRAKTNLMTIEAPKFDAYSEMEWGDNRKTNSAAIPQANDHCADADWMRFSFGSGDEALFKFHCSLRDAWGALGIEIDRLDHMQYCERYHVSQNDQRAVLQYWYKGDKRVSRVDSGQRHLGHPALIAAALAAMREVLIDRCEQDGNLTESDFVRAFRERVETSLISSDILLVSHRIIQYGVRFCFEEGGRRSEIDFFHNEMPKWTAVREVRGPGASGGLIDRLRPLLGD